MLIKIKEGLTHLFLRRPCMITQVHNKLWVNFDNICHIRFETLPGTVMMNKQIVIYQLKDSGIECEDDFRACHLRWKIAIRAHNSAAKNKVYINGEGEFDEKQAFDEISIMLCPLTDATKKSLRNNKIYTMGDLMKLDRNTLSILPGIGGARANKILQLVEKLKEETNE